ncbi:hypothetical protein D3C79_1009270 [compost metagenome]
MGRPNEQYMPPQKPDYETSSIEQNETERAISTTEGNLSIRQSFGGFELVPYINNPTILAVTLSLMFWPDRNMPDVCAQVVSTVQNG